MARAAAPKKQKTVSCLADKARRAIETNLIRHNTRRSTSDERLSLEAFDEGEGRHRVLVLRDGPGRRDSCVVFELAIDEKADTVAATGPSRQRHGRVAEFETVLTLLCEWIHALGHRPPSGRCATPSRESRMASAFSPDEEARARTVARHCRELAAMTENRRAIALLLEYADELDASVRPPTAIAAAVRAGRSSHV
jgi:hypothetical protein